MRQLFTLQLRRALLIDLSTVVSMVAAAYLLERIALRSAKVNIEDLSLAFDIFLLGLVAFLTLIGGVRVFAGEGYEGRRLFLDALPLSRSRVWAAIILAEAAGGGVALAAVVAGRPSIVALPLLNTWSESGLGFFAGPGTLLGILALLWLGGTAIGLMTRYALAATIATAFGAVVWGWQFFATRAYMVVGPGEDLLLGDPGCFLAGSALAAALFVGTSLWLYRRGECRLWSVRLRGMAILAGGSLAAFLLLHVVHQSPLASGEAGDLYEELRLHIDRDGQWIALVTAAEDHSWVHVVDASDGSVRAEQPLGKGDWLLGWEGGAGRLVLVESIPSFLGQSIQDSLVPLFELVDLGTARLASSLASSATGHPGWRLLALDPKSGEIDRIDLPSGALEEIELVGRSGAVAVYREGRLGAVYHIDLASREVRSIAGGPMENRSELVVHGEFATVYFYNYVAEIRAWAISRNAAPLEPAEKTWFPRVHVGGRLYGTRKGLLAASRELCGPEEPAIMPDAPSFSEETIAPAHHMLLLPVRWLFKVRWNPGQTRVELSVCDVTAGSWSLITDAMHIQQEGILEELLNDRSPWSRYSYDPWSFDTLEGFSAFLEERNGLVRAKLYSALSGEVTDLGAVEPEGASFFTYQRPRSPLVLVRPRVQRPANEDVEQERGAVLDTGTGRVWTVHMPDGADAWNLRFWDESGRQYVSRYRGGTRDERKFSLMEIAAGHPDRVIIEDLNRSSRVSR